MRAEHNRFFPAQSRQFPGKRWLNISLRTLHLIGIAGSGGAVLLGQPYAGWQSYLLLTLISGSLMVILSIWSNGIWLLQLRGQLILLKLAILGLIPLIPSFQAGLLLIVLLISGLIAHAPGAVRYYSLYHKRRIN